MRCRLSLPIPAAQAQRHPSISFAQTQLEQMSGRASIANGILPDLGYIQSEVTHWLLAADTGMTYRQVFHAKWRRSKSTAAITVGISARELELFDHAARRFPCVSLSNYWWGGEERPPGFLVRNGHYGISLPEEWDEDDLVVLVLECLCSEWHFGYEQERAALIQERLNIPLPDGSQDKTLDMQRFRKACNTQRTGAWRHLVRAIQVAGHATGNPFLEPSPHEEPVGRFMTELGISPRAIHQLEQSAHEAQSFLHALGEVQRWLTHEPHIWSDIFAVWQSCLILKRASQNEGC